MAIHCDGDVTDGELNGIRIFREIEASHKT